MKRYKLVRIVMGRFMSANTTWKRGELEYTVGKVTKASGLGIACYKSLTYLSVYHHLHETMHYFNHDEPIAILEVEPIGQRRPRVDYAYGKGDIYEGGINYPAVKVVKVIRTINKHQLETYR